MVTRRGKESRVGSRFCAEYSRTVGSHVLGDIGAAQEARVAHLSEMSCGVGFHVRHTLALIHY